MHWAEAKGIKSESQIVLPISLLIRIIHTRRVTDPQTPSRKSSGGGGIRLDISVFMFGTYSQCSCWAHIHRMFLCHNIWQQHFKTNRTVTLLIISLKSEMLWGWGEGGLELWTICSTYWKVLMAIHQARCERSTRYRPRPKCLGNALWRQAVNMVIFD